MTQKPTYEALEQRIAALEKQLAEKRTVATPHASTAKTAAEAGPETRTEAALRIFKLTVEAASDAIGFSTPDGRHWYQNQAFDALFGDIGADPPASTYVDSEQGRRIFERLKQGGQWRGEVEMYDKNRNIIQVLLRAYAVKDETGAVTNLVGIHTDITDRKQDEKELQQTRALLAAAINQSPSGILIADAPDVRIRLANPAAFMIRGGSEQYLTDIEVAEHAARWQTFHADGAPYDPRDLPLSRAILKGEISKDVEVIIRSESGEEHWVSANAAPIRDPEGVIRAGIVIFHDITEKVHAKAALKQSESKFRTLVEKSPLGICLIDKDGRIQYVNPRFYKIFGYIKSEVPTVADWMLKAYPDETYRRAAMQTWAADQQRNQIGESPSRVFTVTCKDGARKEIQFKRVAMENGDQFVLAEDVTEKTKMEQQLQQIQKFEAIATLAGGIAHDFNNLLMGMQGRTSLMLTDPAFPCLHAEHLTAFEGYIRSATQLTRQLLGFARGGKYEVKPIEVNTVLQSSAAMFGRTKKEIDIHITCHAEPLVVEADQGQIEQVLLNLYVNAWQAMPDGGKLLLSTTRARLNASDCAAYQVAPGDYAKITVSDTGIGMSPEVRQRVFDPFFTTKDKTRGTGLGLASAYGIIKNHDGLITVYSEPGHGATFNIFLPLTHKEAGRPAETKTESLPRGSETILLVDDEDIIIDVGQAMLEQMGYTVMTARGGEAALNLIEKNSKDAGRIALVILDMIMPGMDGGKTFDRIRETWPDIPVILSSGYALNGQAGEIMRRGCDGFIQKPFNIHDLSNKVRTIFDTQRLSSR